MIAARWWVLGLMLGAGCAGGRTSMAVSPPLGGTVTAVEVTERGHARVLPETGVAEVDVNSVIHLEMNQGEIARIMAALVDIDDREAAALARRAALLDTVTRAQTAALVHLRALAERAGTGRPVEREALARLGQLEEDVVAAVSAYAGEVGLPAATFFRKPGYQVIDEERSRVLARSAEVASALEAVRWRLEAGLSKDGASMPIHLDNYDELPEQALYVIRKLEPALATGDLRWQLQVAADLARSLTHLMEAQEALDQQILGPLERNLRQLRALLRDDLPALDMLQRSLAGRVGSSPEGVRLMVALDVLRLTLRAVQDRCARAMRLLEEPAQAGLAPATGGGVARDAAAGDDARAQALLDCASAIGEALADDLPAMLAQVEDTAKLLLQRADVVPALRRELGDLNGLRRLIVVYDRAQEYWGSSFTIILGTRHQLVDPTEPRIEFIDRKASDIANTAIEITRTRREEGDVVHFRPSIVKDGVPILVGLDRTFLVVRAGLRLDVSVSLNFIRPVSRREDEIGFRAAPAVTATLHYHAWREDGEHTGNRLWNFLDPGLGVHLAYPDLGVTRLGPDNIVEEYDPAAEIGVGGVLQLFGDLCQIGYGYDLQVGRAYWYLGIGLHTLTDLGISIPIPRGGFDDW